MVKLTDEKADQQLDAWWQKLRRPRFWWQPRRQQIVHVLRPFVDGEFKAWEAFHEWCAGNPNAIHCLDQDVKMRRYLAGATLAAENGAVSTRIFFARPQDFEGNSRSNPRYAAEVQYPFIAAHKTNETAYWISPDDYKRAGFPERDADVNIWGGAGIMRTKYVVGGGVDSREFLTWWRNPLLYYKERRFVRAVARFARRHGTRIEPAKLS